MGPVIIKKFKSRHEAEVVQGFLQANGIPAIIRSDDCGAVDPMFQLIHGVALLVAPADAQGARELLGQFDQEPPDEHA